MAAVRAGDDAAFEELFSRYRDRISAFVHGAVSDHARAEDIAQEVFISALRRMRDTERPISFKPWIYEIARNACIDEFRRSRRATEVSLNQNADSAGAGLQLPSPEPPPDVVVEERQKLHNLQGAFGGLSENHHRILVMRELEGLSYGEIGERLGMSRAMVESTLFRARKRLNQEFRELESGQRCERVRSAIDRSELRSPRVLGVRDRRQVARHMAYCRQCRQYAWTAGFDASSLKRRGAAQKIAALLPLGWWHGRGGAVRQGTRAPSMAAAKATAKLARHSEPLSQIGLGRAVAAAAALAFAAAGGGYVVSGSNGHHSATTANTASLALPPTPARAPQTFVRATHAVSPAAAIAHTKASSSWASDQRRGGRPGRHDGGHSGGGSAAAKPAAVTPTSGGGASSGSSARAGSAAGAASTSPSKSSAGGHGLLGSLLSGGSSSPGGSAPRLPSVPRVPSVPNSSLNTPTHLPAPAQGAAKAASQGAKAATQAVNNAAQTVGSVGGKASNLVGGAGDLGGSRPGLSG